MKACEIFHLVFARQAPSMHSNPAVLFLHVGLNLSVLGFLLLLVRG